LSSSSPIRDKTSNSTSTSGALGASSGTASSPNSVDGIDPPRPLPPAGDKSLSGSINNTLRKVAPPHISIKGFTLGSGGGLGASGGGEAVGSSSLKGSSDIIRGPNQQRRLSTSDSFQEQKILVGGVLCKAHSISYRGNPAWVAVIDQMELHCITPRLSRAFILLHGAFELLLGIADKLTALGVQ